MLLRPAAPTDVLELMEVQAGNSFWCLGSNYFYKKDEDLGQPLNPIVSTTLVKAMGYRLCLPLSDVQFKGKHCQNPIAVKDLQIHLGSVVHV